MELLPWSCSTVRVNGSFLFTVATLYIFWEHLGQFGTVPNVQIIERCPYLRVALYTSLCSWDSRHCSH